MSNIVPEDNGVIGIKDKSNPRSLINILPTVMATRLEAVPDDLFLLTEKELERQAEVTDIEKRLRIQFWNEYNTAQAAPRRMNIKNVVAGICTDSYFNKKIITNSFKVAYICTPLADYKLQMQELLRMGFEQIKDIMMRPHTDQYGNLEPRAADVKFKIWQDVANREIGMVVHRIESKNLNVNVDAGMPNNVEDLNDPEAIKKQIEELEAKAGRPRLAESKSTDGIIDVTAQPERCFVKRVSKED